MDDVRRFNALMDGSMPCYGDAATLEDIRRMFSYVFDPATPKGGGLPQLDLRVIDGPFSVGDIHLQPVPIWHGRRRILGFRVGGFAYLTDCSRIDEAAWPLLERLEVLVLDALREKPHPTHFSLSDAIETAARIGAARTFFTHMAHDLPHEATNARLPDGMRLAHDGLVLSMPNAEC
jgi:phosphoribosyl 1,2-cyclic phosphate phosphodiesterase